MLAELKIGGGVGGGVALNGRGRTDLLTVGIQ